MNPFRFWLFNSLRIAIGLAMVFFAGTTMGQESAIQSAEFVFEKAPFPSCHASTIVQSERGTLLCAWFGGTREKDPDVGIWLSHLVDGHWTPPIEVADGVTQEKDARVRYPSWNPVLFQPLSTATVPHPPLILFYKVGPSPETWWGMMKTSQDNGASWSPPIRLPEGILGPIKNKPVELSNGRWLCPSSTESHEEQSKWQVHFEVTDDQGKSWQRIGPINDGVAIEAIQPSILKLGGERLLAIGRTRQNKIFESQSEDLGKTWGPMGLGMLPNNNSGIDAVTLADGRHAIIYNHVGGEPGQWGGKRTPINLAISDDGHQWQSQLILDQGPGEFSYPAIIQSRDGMLHITYTWKRERIKHVVIDPAKLMNQ